MKVVAFSPPALVDFDAVSEPYWASLRDGTLSLQRCAHGHGFRMPPTLYCSECHSTESEWVRLSGRGRLYSYTIIPLKSKEGDGAVYVAALVCPEEAPDTKLFANIVDCTDDQLAIGLELELVRPEPGSEVALFRPIFSTGREIANA